jgi:hypothetical protein
MRTWRIFMPLRVAPGADPQEGDAVAVGRVHVRLDLEDEAGERSSGSTTRCTVASGARRRGVVHEGVEQLLDPEVVDGRAEEDRGLRPPVGVEVERVARALDQLHLLAQLRGLVAQQLVHARVVEPLDHLAGLDAPAVLGAEEVGAVVRRS